MKTLYLECDMGASGDMLLAALYELLPDRETFLKTMNGLISGVTVGAERALTCGVSGTHMEVLINGAAEKSEMLPGDGKALSRHFHSAPEDIHALIAGFPLPDEVRKNAAGVYDLIAEAESAAHGVPVTQVHFHEVGALDAVADVTGVCFAMHLLSPDRVQVSTIRTGFGQIHCAHGILPVPAPATAYLLRGLPCCGGEIGGELCTPTGAALLKRFAQDFGPMPEMRLESIGVGVGKKKLPAANCVRAFWGEAETAANDAIVELCCHIDDMTAEALAFASEQLMELGALDVSSAPITMKKGRAGIAFTVLCQPADEKRLAEAVLRETNTNGIRARRCAKYILRPSVQKVETKYGPIRVKCAEGRGIRRAKPEYEDVAASAKKAGASFQQVWEETLLAIRREDGEA